MTKIKGSAEGTIPWSVFKFMREQNREMTFAEIYAHFPEGVSRGAVSYAMNDLGKRGVVAVTGKRRFQIYSLTGVELPTRVPMAPYWKKEPKAVTVKKTKPPAVAKPKGKSGPKTAESHFDGNEFLRLPKFRTPREPERVCCKTCEWLGAQSGCTDCKYVLPNERIAA